MGVPIHNDIKLFEFLALDSMQAGLSWITILRKRENYRKAFDNFNAEKIVKYDDKKIGLLLSNEGIIRNKLKVNAVINNAKAFLEIQNEFVAFEKYIGDLLMVKHKNKWKTIKEILSETKSQEK
jgi:DNA-3-methyladenine glycosylase I